MAEHNSSQNSIRILAEATANAEVLFEQRCPSGGDCKLAAVFLEPGQPTVRVPGSDMIWFEDMTHGIACARDCHFADKPLEVTAIFTEAVQKTVEDLGIIAITDSPTRKDSPDFN